MRDLGIAFMVIAIWSSIWATGASELIEHTRTSYILSTILLSIGGFLFILGGGKK